MNIRFKSIDIENFRSIKRAYVELANQGTVIVRGINEYEDKATSNGSGKSSMFEAIIFALFEETSGGEKDVANRVINDGYTINLVFEIDGVEYSILRQLKSGKTTVCLFKNGIDISARNKTDTNKLIVQLIGINKNIFLDSVLLSQGANTNLATLTPTARKERLEILTNTDVTISKFKDALKERQNEYEAECVGCQMEMNKIMGRQEALRKQASDVENQLFKIEQEIAQRQASNRVSAIEQEIKQLEQQDFDYDKQIENISACADDNDKAMEEARLKLDEIVVVKDQLEQQRSAKREEYNQISNELNKANFDISFEQQTQKRLDKEVEDIKNSDKCPTCGRKYENTDDTHIVEVIEQKTQLWNNAQINIDNLRKLVAEKDATLTEIAKQGQEIGAKIDEVQPAYQQASSMLNDMIAKGRNYTFEQTKCYNAKKQIQDKISYLQIILFKL
jgi:DNA repair exonuclease SbcCD ATPase subunit